MVYFSILSFGVAAGSIPVVFLFLTAFFAIGLAFVAGKLKEGAMDRNQNQAHLSVLTKKTAAKFAACKRKVGAETLQFCAAVGTNWAAGAVPLQLSRVA